METNKIVRVLLVTAIILLIPILGMQLVEGWDWSVFDFVFAGILIAGTGFVYELAAKQATQVTYRIAVGVALAAAFLLIWINGAVGIIGSEDNPANLLYGAVLIALLIGSVAARFKPQAMSRALFVTAAVQALVPITAFIIWRPDFSPGVVAVFMLNAFWVALWVVSGLLFLQSSETPQLA